MKQRTLRFKIMAAGFTAVLVSILVVGGFSIYSSVDSIEELSRSRTVEVAKGLAQMADLALQEELKIVVQTAQRDVVIEAAANATNEAVLAKATTELTVMLQRSGSDYESFVVTGADGKVIADSLGGKTRNIDLSDRDYIKTALTGKANVGSVVKSKNSGNIILTFGAPIYSKSHQVIGVMASVMKISFLADKVSAAKLGETGYGYTLDKTGLAITHPKAAVMLKANGFTEEGMKDFTPRMVAGETGSQAYVFRGVKKMAGFAPVPIAGWSVCMTQDYNEFLTPAYHLAFIIILLTLIFLVLTLVGMFLMARGIVLPIGKIANDLDDASEQIATASSQVASASQSLAEGASEQASAIEETSSSLEELTSMTKQNADNAAQAKAFTIQARQIVEKVDGQMKNMVASVQEVTRSSEETGKIIKTIDEIAFQTNLLALNAAVEAARAGEAGAGFAVVADEVRNLAMRSADAAKNTSHLIENIIVTVKNSRDLTRQTQEAFRENMEISGKIDQLIDEIAAASGEQAQGIEQIGKAVVEMDKVVQQTAANAEESASVSEEMNAQAMLMKDNMGHLVMIITGGNNGNSPTASRRRLEIGKSPAAQKPVSPTIKRLLADPSVTLKKGRPVCPQDVIPFETDGFKDF